MITEPRNIRELRKMFPSDEYFLVRQRKPLRGFGTSVIGVYEVNVYSPSHRGEKQPVEYYRWRN